MLLIDDLELIDNSLILNENFQHHYKPDKVNLGCFIDFIIVIVNFIN
jgi:hypothetical protein